jgi:hypothetical protein
VHQNPGEICKPCISRRSDQGCCGLKGIVFGGVGNSVMKFEASIMVTYNISSKLTSNISEESEVQPWRNWSNLGTHKGLSSNVSLYRDVSDASCSIRS